jgi:hypothetical protein
MRVKFTKRIARGIGRCNKDAFLFRWVDIPIDPYPELVVVENDWEGVIDKVVIWQGNPLSRVGCSRERLGGRYRQGGHLAGEQQTSA